MKEHLTHGTRVTISGSPHHGKTGSVVDAAAVLRYANAVAGKTGRIITEGPIKRGNMVPVALDDFPETLWWWFAPHQLIVDRSTQDTNTRS